jgi:hypothetical protein
MKSRSEYKKMTDTLKEYRESIGKDKTSFFHYSNEANMIDIIVLGVTSKQYKVNNDLDPKVSSIRPYLNKEEIKYTDMLQEKNTHLIELGMEYEVRKNYLINYYMRISQKSLNKGGNNNE